MQELKIDPSFQQRGLEINLNALQEVAVRKEKEKLTAEQYPYGARCAAPVM